MLYILLKNVDKGTIKSHVVSEIISGGQNFYVWQ